MYLIGEGPEEHLTIYFKTRKTKNHGIPFYQERNALLHSLTFRLCVYLQFCWAGTLRQALFSYSTRYTILNLEKNIHLPSSSVMTTIGSLLFPSPFIVNAKS